MPYGYDIPEHGSRWWRMDDDPVAFPGVGDVIHDKRFKRYVRYFLLNNLLPHGRRSNKSTATPPKLWDNQWVDQPTDYLDQWVVSGSVWRRLPPVGWWDTDRTLRVRLDDLVMVERVAQRRTIYLAEIRPDGTLKPHPRMDSYQFLLHYARVWQSQSDRLQFHPVPLISDDPHSLFPDVLYSFGLLKHVKTDIPTAADVVRAVASIDQAEQTIDQARDVIKRHKVGTAVIRRKKAPKKKRPRRSAWERIMEDD